MMFIFKHLILYMEVILVPPLPLAILRYNCHKTLCMFKVYDTMT